MTFSSKHGFRTRPKEIRFRDELPSEFRIPIFDILKRYANGRFLAQRIEALLNPYGIDPLPLAKGPILVSKEEDDTDLVLVKRVILGCYWFQIYDIVEDLFRQMDFDEDNYSVEPDDQKAYPFARDINDYFNHVGIGWQLVNGNIVTRSDDVSEAAIKTAVSELSRGGRPTAASHIQSATHALSERPKPNTSGAVSHATNSVECVLNDITGVALTLGKYPDKYPDLFHPALKKSLDGVYGYASDAGARHGREGIEPTVEEAQFAVTTCAAACTLLSATNPKTKA